MRLEGAVQNLAEIVTSIVPPANRPIRYRFWNLPPARHRGSLHPRRIVVRAGGKSSPEVLASHEPAALSTADPVAPLPGRRPMFGVPYEDPHHNPSVADWDPT